MFLQLEICYSSPMQQYLSIFIVVILSILTILLVAVGVTIIQVLQKVKYTIDRLNITIDMAENKISNLTAPLQSISGIATSLGSGLKVFESFVGWMNKSKDR